MKKILFVLLAVLTLGLTNVKADVAPPDFEEKYVEVTLDGNKDVQSFTELITKINGLVGVTKMHFKYTDANNYKIVVRVNLEYTLEEIKKVDGVSSAKYLDSYTDEECKCDSPQNTGTGECLKNEDINKLQKTTYIVYITEAILVIVMVIVIVLIVKKAKNNKKED